MCAYHRLPPLKALNPPLLALPPPCAARGCVRDSTLSEGHRHRPTVALRPGGSDGKVGRAFPAESHSATASMNTWALPVCEGESSSSLCLHCLIVRSRTIARQRSRKFGARFFPVRGGGTWLLLTLWLLYQTWFIQGNTPESQNILLFCYIIIHAWNVILIKWDICTRPTWYQSLF